jgi:hypothetical protein
LQVQFEDLVAEPRRVLEEIAAFFRMPGAPGWIERAAGMVDPALIRSSVSDLSPADRERLDRACLPGEVLLGRREHPWVFPVLELVRELEAYRPACSNPRPPGSVPR